MGSEQREEYIIIDGCEHRVGDDECKACWGWDYPKRCECGGLMHSEFGDENWDGDYWLYTRCDRCGEKED